MNRILLFVGVMALGMASVAEAQVIVYPTRVTTYYAPGVVAAPTYVAPRAVVQTYYAPAAVVPAYGAPVVAAPRTTTYYSSVTSMPLATVPVRARYIAPAPIDTVVVEPPVVTYSPVVAYPAYAPVAVGRPVVAGQGIVGQPKLYVPGQPVRNTARFLSP